VDFRSYPFDELKPSADTYTSKAAADTNYGAATTVRFGGHSTNR
jgi:hypothetical protein